MNERIIEFAQQSMWSKTDYSQENEMYSFSRAELEKFAELLIRECIKAVHDKGETYSAYLIEKHFEVEE